MIRGRNAVGGADSSVVGGMGVVSTRSSSLRSAESDEIELSDEKSTMVGRFTMWDGGWAVTRRYGTDGIVFGATVALTALGGCCKDHTLRTLENHSPTTPPAIRTQTLTPSAHHDSASATTGLEAS